MASNVALIFGASGISRWALTNSLRSYPSPTTFSQIIALINHPLSLESSRLSADPRIELYSGTNLQGTLQDVVSQMQKIPNLNQVIHMYYCLLECYGLHAESFVPNSTTMNYVEAIALYLALYRYVNGAGATVPFPG
ncbi:hypothetical protein AWENTII_011885 [Aspergillus wentii]|nr:hypothetical protein MW887_008363 [Aspergillus wentii]